jgi:hypothetical protein
MDRKNSTRKVYRRSIDYLYKRINLAFTLDEYSTIERHVKQTGYKRKISKWIRDTILSQIPEVEKEISGFKQTSLFNKRKRLTKKNFIYEAQNP